MPRKIIEVRDNDVIAEPDAHGNRTVAHEKFGVTDQAIALVPGNEFEKGVPNNFITKFAPQVAAGLSETPVIDRNPYNFVEFAGDEPWLFSPVEDDEKENLADRGHDTFADVCGTIEFTATSRTPCFIPEGFPFQGRNADEDDALRKISRRFFRLANSRGEERYAIPGASFKGALRAAVEAITNSRLGVSDTVVFGQFPHLYRRRVFQAGRLVRKLPNNDWVVEQLISAHPGPGDFVTDNLQGLLVAMPIGKDPDKHFKIGKGSYVLPAALAEGFTENADHPHFDAHWEREIKNQEKGKGFYLDLDANNYKNEITYPLGKDDIIYFTLKGNRIENLGKNVNYLWPAKTTLANLAAPFSPREGRAAFNAELDMAEFMFGFNGEKRSGGHPFQGNLRFETLWGPKTTDAVCKEIRLAALTGPVSKGKSRPLYLSSDTEVSGSFDDPNPKLKGRKFYWHQRWRDGASVWVKHTFDGIQGSKDAKLREGISKQCPPPIQALGKDSIFSGRIHFSNLNQAALGALLFALRGFGDKSHTFHLGKAKPRGLGSFRIDVTALNIDRLKKRYESLTQPLAVADKTAEIDAIVRAFGAWCATRIGKKTDEELDATPLHSHPHIQDFLKLHTWPAEDSVRSYPINFNQYSWLPFKDDVDGEPQAGAQMRADKTDRPPAMGRARDLNP